MITVIPGKEKPWALVREEKKRFTGQVRLAHFKLDHVLL